MPLKVLIVEDEYLVREIAVDALTAAGFDVLDAADGEEALAYCKDDTPDVLFTDIRLPGLIDGGEIAERCRQHHPALPVIYATAFSRDQMRAVPGSVLFRKPYTPESLVNVIQALTDIRVEEPVSKLCGKSRWRTDAPRRRWPRKRRRANAERG